MFECKSLRKMSVLNKARHSASRKARDQ